MKYEKIYTAAILGLFAVIALAVLGEAYKFKYKNADTITVTGLGEQEFTSDVIVWRAGLTQQATSVEQGYAQLEANKTKVQQYLISKGIEPSAVVFMFVNVNPTSEPFFSAGQYVGQKNTGYMLRQDFTIESSNVEAVENVSREISALIAQGVNIDSYAPEYFYSGLKDLKLTLIQTATQDAKLRAIKIAEQAGAKLGKLASAKMGVFQITGANTNEEFSAGGNFNSASKNKKARITMRLEYHLR